MYKRQGLVGIICRTFHLVAEIVRLFSGILERITGRVKDVYKRQFPLGVVTSRATMPLPFTTREKLSVSGCVIDRPVDASL